jgi:hypothetical protein
MTVVVMNPLLKKVYKMSRKTWFTGNERMNNTTDFRFSWSRYLPFQSI